MRLLHVSSRPRLAPVVVTFFFFAVAASTVLLIEPSWAFGAPVNEKGAADESAISLLDAVEAFNDKAGSNRIGQAEPALTEDEVIASIRGIIRTQHTGMTDDVYNALQKIVATRMLPGKAKLDFTTGWRGYNGYDFTVWWVDITIMTGDKTGYTYRLRDRKISSRPLTNAEREELKKG